MKARQNLLNIVKLKKKKKKILDERTLFLSFLRLKINDQKLADE